MPYSITNTNMFTCVGLYKPEGSTLVLNKNNPNTKVLSQIEAPYHTACSLDIKNNDFNGFNYEGGRNFT